MEIFKAEHNLVLTDFVLITNSDGSFTTMPKAEYDRQQAEQSTPSVTNGD
jgi:hypothetical protein